MEDWLKAHSAATTQTAPAPVWDPRTGSWGETPATRRTRKLPRSTSTVRAALAGGIVGAVVAAAVAVPVARMVDPAQPRAVTVRQAPAAAGSDDGAVSIVDIASRARPWV